MSDGSFYSVGARSILLHVKARPGSRQDAVAGVRGGELLVDVRAQPEKGRANEEIVRLLARALGVARESVVLKLGGGSRRKLFEVPLSCLEALERLRDESPGGLR